MTSQPRASYLGWCGCFVVSLQNRLRKEKHSAINVHTRCASRSIEDLVVVFAQMLVERGLGCCMKPAHVVHLWFRVLFKHRKWINSIIGFCLQHEFRKKDTYAKSPKLNFSLFQVRPITSFKFAIWILFLSLLYSALFLFLQFFHSILFHSRLWPN